MIITILNVIVKRVPGPLAQSAERGADNAKVVSSSLTWTIFFFLSPHGIIFFSFSMQADVCGDYAFNDKAN